jgi:hypothetical protein
MAAFLGLSLSLAACADSTRLEFPSCDRPSTAIEVLTIPNSYGLDKGDKLVDTSLPADDVRRVAFYTTHLFTTYPSFDPLATATSQEKADTQAALGDPRASAAWLTYGNGIEFPLFRDLRPESGQTQAPPALETPDGAYWLYPDRFARSGRPSHDRMNHYYPKDRHRSVVIECLDRGDNGLPTSGPRCKVLSLFTEKPALSCLTIGFRIRPEDLPNWREFDARLKQKIESMLTERTP